VSHVAVTFLHETDAEVGPGVFEYSGWLKADIGEDVAHPAWHVKNILQNKAVGVFASYLTSDADNDGANIKDGNLALVSKSKDIRFKRIVGLEASVIGGDAHVQGGRKDPVIAGTRMLTSLLFGTNDYDTAPAVVSSSCS